MNWGTDSKVMLIIYVSELNMIAGFPSTVPHANPT